MSGFFWKGVYAWRRKRLISLVFNKGKRKRHKLHQVVTEWHAQVPFQAQQRLHPLQRPLVPWVSFVTPRWWSHTFCWEALADTKIHIFPMELHKTFAEGFRNCEASVTTVPFSLSAICPSIRCHTWLPNSCWAEFSPVHIRLYPPSENLSLAISRGNTEFTLRVRKKETLPGLESCQQAGKHNQCGRNF